MLLDEMQLHDDEGVVQENDCKESQGKANKKKDFYKFDSDEECVSKDTIESEASAYLGSGVATVGPTGALAPPSASMAPPSII